MDSFVIVETDPQTGHRRFWVKWTNSSRRGRTHWSTKLTPACLYTTHERAAKATGTTNEHTEPNRNYEIRKATTTLN